MFFYFVLALVVGVQSSTVTVEPSTSFFVVESSMNVAASSAVSNETSVSSTMALNGSSGSTTVQGTTSIPSSSSTAPSSTTAQEGTTSISPSPATSSSPLSSTVGLNFGNLGNDLTEYKVSFTLNETWNANFAVNTSTAYQTKAAEIVSAFDALYVNDSYYVTTVVNGFTEGSIVASTTVQFNFPTDVEPAVKTASANKISSSSSQIGTLTIVAGSTTLQEVIDGVWTGWTNTGSCNSDTLKQTQTRSCTGPFGGGSPCSGSTTQEITCVPSDATAHVVSSVLISTGLLFFTTLCM
ncbi:uncharacterized protein LOC130655879 [Hydractinia symbiolongicarpus]|uniref:uncharacterized protein LOC130655879 n=1 Tax=Hydractinia symbiolongicarpus TaxID=13093 RepID=UPI00255144E6|nr:uncharacterized protein LOC130655879 [Hydractinia symbiolongicarpus]